MIVVFIMLIAPFAHLDSNSNSNENVSFSFNPASRIEHNLRLEQFDYDRDYITKDINEQLNSSNYKKAAEIAKSYLFTGDEEIKALYVTARIH